MLITIHCNIKWTLSNSFLSCKDVKLKLKVYSTYYIVTMVTYNVKKEVTTCSLMFVYVLSTEKLKGYIDLVEAEVEALENAGKFWNCWQPPL